ncbi:putative protein translocase complex, SecE/Sec61-gamma subunit, protein translocase SecE [Medicago truncatula]|nr:putative protein translocase complex, SecE/Sec61-gamma subunit, protein translocase SecE [Medicago truncatula]
MDAIDSVFDPLREFAKDSVRLVKRCHKPDRKEFSKVAVRTAIGFVVMGFVGFFVKLIFIPINNIIVGSGDDNGNYNRLRKSSCEAYGGSRGSQFNRTFSALNLSYVFSFVFPYFFFSKTSQFNNM